MRPTRFVQASLDICLSMIFLGKPVSTFPDHALAKLRRRFVGGSVLVPSRCASASQTASLAFITEVIIKYRYSFPCVPIPVASPHWMLFDAENFLRSRSDRGRHHT